MKPNLHTTKRALLALMAICICTAESCSLVDDRTIDFDFTGQVLDYDTKQPIEGAYALAVYEKVDLGLAASARYCVKTKGMVTGKDGKFNFPIERLDSVSPAQVFAIRADYYLRANEPVASEARNKNNKETYSNRHVYLKRQDPAKPEFLYGFRRCERPLSTEAIEPAIKFMQLEISESNKYGRDVRSTNSISGSIESMQRAASSQTYSEKK
ncbi:MAG: hypothetical protein ABI790_03350 [Betaproteobacteria bacterium]